MNSTEFEKSYYYKWRVAGGNNSEANIRKVIGFRTQEKFLIEFVVNVVFRYMIDKFLKMLFNNHILFIFYNYQKTLLFS